MRWRPGLELQVSTILFFSGAAALIDEHLAAKLLSRVVGSSADAVAAVLVAFMGGLGLGARHVARRPWRIDPFRRYARVEVGIGALALAMPVLLQGLSLLFASAGDQSTTTLAAIRMGIAMLVVGAPGFLMGMTFPLILEATSRRIGQGMRVARFYAANTLGGACGVLCSTYLLLPALGIWGTLLVAVGCNLLVALWALGLHRWFRTPAAHEPAAAPPTPTAVLDTRLALIIAGGSGLLAFALEVLYFRVLATIVGSSVYAFGLMLFVFLLGNGIGSRIADHPRLRSCTWLATFQVAVGALCLVVMPLWDKMPDLFREAGQFAPSFVFWELTRFLAVLLLLIGPTIAMGAAFGLLLRLATGGTETSRLVGRLYAVNTAGAIAGALLPTLVLAPWLGSERSMTVVAWLEIALAALALVPLRSTWRRLAIAIPALCVAILVPVFRPPWNLQSLLSGANVYFGRGFGEFDRVRFFSEDRSGGLVAVVERNGVRTLLGNAKFEGNDAFEVRDQYMFALLPLLFVRSEERALNIGVGTGGSLAVMASFPFRHIDAVEISSAVLAAARQEFSKVNHGVLDDRRVAVHVEDGRNFLLRSSQRYDLVVTQLSSVWIGGMADLYNREFYELVRRRLRPDGVVQQWLQLHHIRARDLASVIHTMRSVFPHITLWVGGHQGILVASPQPLSSDLARLRAWRDSPRIARVLRQADMLHPYSAFGHLYLDEEGIARLIDEVARTEGTTLDGLISADMLPRLEYSTPRGNVISDALEQNMGLLRRHAQSTPLRYAVNVGGELDRRIFLAYAAHERQFKTLAKWLLQPVVREVSRDPVHLPLLRDLAKAGKDLVR